MSTPLEPIPTPFPQRMADFKRRRVPLLVWLGAAVIYTFFMVGSGTRYDCVGLALSASHEISAPATGRIESLLVAAYDDVEAGQVLARIDDAEVEARLERSLATIRQLTAELEAARARGRSNRSRDQSEMAGDLRQFQTNEEQRRLKVLELRVTVESDEIQEERLALDQSRSGRLLEEGLIGQAEHDSIRLRHEEVARRNEQNTTLLHQLEQEYASARTRRMQFEQGLPELPEQEPELLPLREAIDVESQRLKEIRARRESLTLRSPVAGHVASVVSREGQTVVPGEPILTVAAHGVTEIVAFLSEADDRTVLPASTVKVSSVKRPGSAAESSVIRAAPGLEILPERLWRDPSIPSYGRAVVIAAAPGLTLLPGELIQVDFLD